MINFYNTIVATKEFELTQKYFKEVFMKMNFGVCSTSPSNKMLKNGYTMYEWVKRQKCFPKFWGRNISGQNAITEDEIVFLKEKGCKILLVFNDLTEAKVSAVNGTEGALKAVEAAKKLGVPQNHGVALFAEIKSEWSVNHNWMISFAHIIATNGYTPAFIGNTDSSKNFNFDRQCSHFVQATKDMNCFNTVFMATEPKCVGTPDEWLPYCPSVLDPNDIDLWSCGKTVFGQIEVEDIYAKDDKVFKNMW